MDGGLIGRGRACDVVDAGPGRVRRIYRAPNPGAPARELAVMRHVAAHGFPVPAVFEHTDDSIVMERVDGPTMLARLAARPWAVDRLARTLADLHRALSAVPAGGLDLAAPFGAAECIAHLDLHPDNVIMGARGPVVIDWTNACLAPAGFDVASTWVVVATGDVSVPAWLRPVTGVLRDRFVSVLVDAAGREVAERWLAAAGERRLDDPSTRPPEAARVRALVERVGGGRS